VVLTRPMLASIALGLGGGRPTTHMRAPEVALEEEAGLETVESLDLGLEGLSSLGGLPRWCPRLRALRLDGNRLSSLPCLRGEQGGGGVQGVAVEPPGADASLACLASCRVLSAAGNRLAGLPPACLPPGLTELRLGGNRLGAEAGQVRATGAK
jgi:Leucine-rich repeat (LRR) protein